MEWLNFLMSVLPSFPAQALSRLVRTVSLQKRYFADSYDSFAAHFIIGKDGDLSIRDIGMIATKQLLRYHLAYASAADTLVSANCTARRSTPPTHIIPISSEGVNVKFRESIP